jgi:hypothetical protein
MTQFTADQIENSIIGAFLDWQDSDAEEGTSTPVHMTYVLLKEAVGLPQLPAKNFEYFDRIKWLTTINDYTLLRNLGYNHFDAIDKLSDIYTRNNL